MLIECSPQTNKPDRGLHELDGGAEEMTNPDGTLLMAQFLRWVEERPRT